MLYKFLYPWAKIYWRIFRPITFGVRVLVIDSQDRIMLVKHTYLPDWMLPGGTAKYDEQFDEVAIREVKEETGVVISKLELLGVYKFDKEGKRDHILVFWVRIDKFPDVLVKDQREIEQIQIFSLDNLSDEISPGHRRRVEEYIAGKRAVIGKW